MGQDDIPVFDSANVSGNVSGNVSFSGASHPPSNDAAIEFYDAHSQSSAPSGAHRQPSADIDYYENGSEGIIPTGSSTGTGISDLTDFVSKGIVDVIKEEQAIYKEAAKFEDAAVVSLVETEVATEKGGKVQKALEITMEDGVTFTVELDSGEKRLLELGYKQELKRVLNCFQLYCIAITTVSIFPYLTTCYPLAFLNGGPAGMLWYWWITVFFVHIVGLCFSEIASSFPTAGSLYYWSAALSGPSMAPVASFFTGWLEFIGLSVGVSSTIFCFAYDFGKPFIFMCTGVEMNEYIVFAITVVVALICLGLNLLPVSVLGHFFAAVAIFEILTAVAVIIGLPAVAVTHQPASFVFGSFESFRTLTQTPSDAYSFLLTLAFSQFVLFGYDSVAHMAEETKRSDRTAPIAIMGAISTISVLCWLLLVSATFSIQDLENAMMAPNAIISSGAPGLAWFQIMFDAFYSRFESPLGAQILAFFISLSAIFRSIVILLAASRVCFSLARDDGIPLARLWKKVSSTTNVPVNAVLFSFAFGFLFLLPCLDSAALLNGIVSISSMAWVAGYALPLLLRFLQKEDDFFPGPFYMADYIGTTGGKIVHLTAFLWIMFTVALFCLPLFFPISYQNFNYASLTITICVAGLVLWWVVDARHWFRGPLRHGADGPEPDVETTPLTPVGSGKALSS